MEITGCGPHDSLQDMIQTVILYQEDAFHWGSPDMGSIRKNSFQHSLAN